jgi:DNA polymerase V
MSAGGKRIGAGRPAGKNSYGEATKPIRIPLSRINAVKAMLLETAKPQSEQEQQISFQEPLIRRNAAPSPRARGEGNYPESHFASLEIPLYVSTVRAGFPSPADDYIECTLDLNNHLIKHPAATFFVRASGDSMVNVGIFSGDILIVDKSLEASHGKIVIAAIDGELTVKRLSCQNGCVQLHAENTAYPPIDITAEQSLVIWGVVTHVIHETK